MIEPKDIKDESYYYIQTQTTVDMMCGKCIINSVAMGKILHGRFDFDFLYNVGAEINTEEHPAKCRDCEKHTDNYDMTQDIRLQEEEIIVSCFVRDAEKTKQITETLFDLLEQAVDEIMSSGLIEEGEDLHVYWIPEEVKKQIAERAEQREKDKEKKEKDEDDG